MPHILPLMLELQQNGFVKSLKPTKSFHILLNGKNTTINILSLQLMQEDINNDIANFVDHGLVRD